MSYVLFLSSAGDTNLGVKAALEISKKNPEEKIILVPLTSAAHITLSKFESQIEQERKENKNITIEDFSNLNTEDLNNAVITLAKEKIKCVYIGVASPLNEDRFVRVADIFSQTQTPCIIANEYMFAPPKEHPVWECYKKLNTKNFSVAVPLSIAKEELHKNFPNIENRISVVGHLSIDAAATPTLSDPAKKAILREDLLHVPEKEELVYVSGTTQPKKVDMDFLTEVLTEFSRGEYSHIQIRFGIHPSVPNIEEYVRDILNICHQYPQLSSQFKIILTPNIKNTLLKIPNLEIDLSSPFLLEVDENISGSDVATNADKVLQAAPGADLNTAVFQGKPALYDTTKFNSYLPKNFFAENIHAFFRAPVPPQNDPAVFNKKELGLDPDSSAPREIARLIVR